MSDDHEIVPVVEAPLDPREQLHPLVAALTRGDLDTETMREVLAMQERWEERQAKAAFTEALVALKAELPTVLHHDRTVDFRAKDGRVHYSHLSLAGLLDAVEPHLTRHGFALTFEAATPSPGVVQVTATLTHEAGHSKSITMSAPPDTGKGRNAIQAIASSTTYLRRYTAAMLLGIATADMPDPDASEISDEEQDAIDATVDQGRNVKMAARLEKAGLSVYEAEELVGRGTADWTGADLRVIWDWAKEQTS